MLWLKLIPPFLAFVITVLQFTLKNRIGKRTTLHKMVRSLLLGIMILALIITAWLIVSEHRSSIKLQKEITETKQMAKSNTLFFIGKEIMKTSEGYILIIHLKSTKDEPLGQLEFTASLPENTKARILDIYEIGLGLMVKERIFQNGKLATLVYSVTGSREVDIGIKLSGATQIRVEGNKGLIPLEFQIE